MILSDKKGLRYWLNAIKRDYIEPDKVICHIDRALSCLPEVEKLEALNKEIMLNLKATNNCLKHARQYIKNRDKDFNDNGNYRRYCEENDILIERAEKELL